DGGALLGQQYGVAERQRHDVHAEPHAPRAPCQGRHRGDRFKERLMTKTIRSVCQIESTPPASHMSIQRQYAAAPENGNSAQPSPIPTPMRRPSYALGRELINLLGTACQSPLCPDSRPLAA